MKSINAELINSKLEAFIKERDWDQFHSIKNLTMALNVEASELLELFQWLKESESNEIKSNEKLKSKAEEEIADIFIYLLRIAIKSDIDIEKVVMTKIEKNAAKYPVEKARGSAKKYSDL